jgi:CDP-diacylglycerol--glycerol-3-phosphate 3-phosphatidyltransferase
MPSIYALKPAFQNLLRPVARAIAHAGGTANQITVLAMVGSAVAGGLIYLFPAERWPLILVGPWLFARMALNAIDGMLAREYSQKSALGGILNEIGDVVSDAALYLPFACVTGFDARLVVVVVILATLTEMIGVVCVQIGASRRYDGPFGKSDRAFAFGAMGLVVGLTGSSGAWITWALVAMVVLLAATIVNRGRKGLAEITRRT